MEIMDELDNVDNKEEMKTVTEDEPVNEMNIDIARITRKEEETPNVVYIDANTDVIIE